MSPVVVLGAGGHAKVVADIAGLLGRRVVAYVDELGSGTVTDVHGVPVVRALEEAPAVPVALGIGDNRSRLERHARLSAAGRPVATLVHPSAVLASTVSLGAGTVVMAGVVVNPDVRVGAAAVLNTACSVDHDCTVGDGAHLAPGSRLAGGVEVGRGALVGVGACVAPSTRLGDWAVCGAGGAVVRDVGPGQVVKGVPAR